MQRQHSYVAGYLPNPSYVQLESVIRDQTDFRLALTEKF